MVKQNLSPEQIALYRAAIIMMAKAVDPSILSDQRWFEEAAFKELTPVTSIVLVVSPDGDDVTLFHKRMPWEEWHSGDKSIWNKYLP